jgi:hypothetical protein
MDEILDRLKSFLSKKLALVVSGSAAISYLPILYKQVGVSDNVSLLVIGTLTSIVLWYLKINKDLANGPSN